MQHYLLGNQTYELIEYNLNKSHLINVFQTQSQTKQAERGIIPVQNQEGAEIPENLITTEIE